MRGTKSSCVTYVIIIHSVVMKADVISDTSTILFSSLPYIFAVIYEA
jgi:hypothetical protein